MPPLIQIGDYLGTLVFAIAGGLAAAEKRLDIGGFFLLAFVTGVGGGTLRDIILARGEVFWADQPVYILLSMLGAAIAFRFGPSVERKRRALLWADAVGLALFAVIGAATATQLGARPITATLMGALTATGGGVIREIIRNEMPIILQREIYLTAALAGSAAYVALDALHAPEWACLGTGIAIAFALRALGMTRNLNLPAYVPPGTP
ncbi:MAG: trimeric intracellular cation channel family protein [Phycisphaeraceae bacterium]|nr:trimeric intracellular cation channel family protein [Phycisphaeraceae bacterium]MCW5767449.1 trimeric intracellular cation channel family protein [Phycisphaeraceae bacterium]